MKDTRIRFDTRTPFGLALQERVSAYFDDRGLSRRGGGAMVVKSVILGAWLVASYVALLAFGGSWLALVACSVSVGLAMAGLGMAVQHDGGHRAYSDTGALNRAAASVLDLLGASSYVWRIKHAVVHHTYPNIVGADDDIDAAPFVRLAPAQRHRAIHRLQHLYIWPLYGVLTARWFLYDDYRDIARGQIGPHRVPAPKGRELAIFVGGKILHFVWALVVPVALLGGWQGLSFYALATFVSGVTLSVVFQLAHCVEEADFFDAKDGLELDFFAHQLATTVDFARDSKFLSWYLGGLNYQAVHHLFPRVCHLHYPALAKIVEATAREFGVRYVATDSLGAALRSHYQWLRRMGVAPAGA